MLPLEGSVLKQLVLPGRVFSTETYAASGRICSKAGCVASRGVFALWQPLLYLDLSGL